MLTSIHDLDPTSSSPDLKRLTSDQVAAFERDGLLLMPGLFSAAEIGPLAQLAGHDPRITGETVEIIDSTGGGAELFGWTGVTDDLLGAYVGIARLVESASDLLAGEPVYHWHSKLSFKKPHSEGRWDWHQDYGSWYLEGCLRSEMLSVMIAVDPCSLDNGCVELIRGSNTLGRIDHVTIGKSRGADPDVVTRALEEMDRVACEIEPGDAVFFHGNTLHASGPNRSDKPRTVLHISYNTVRNAPSRGYDHHAYVPLKILSDDVLERRAYNVDMDQKTHADSRASWQRGREKLGNVYGYEVNRSD